MIWRSLSYFIGMARPQFLKRLGVGCLTLVVVVAGGLVVTGYDRLLIGLWKNGTIQAYLFPDKKRTYSATNEANLKAIYTAMMLYHDSEEKFPEGNGWMDAIQNRLMVNDMTPDEAKKKLVRPDLAGQAGQFGYAINAKAAGKYKDDAGPKSTVLVFESREKGRNAVGDPEKDRDGMAITIDGKLLSATGH